jgi:hypothetical protein
MLLVIQIIHLLNIEKTLAVSNIYLFINIYTLMLFIILLFNKYGNSN